MLAELFIRVPAEAEAVQVDRDARSRRSSLHRALSAIFVPRSARLSSRRIGLAVLFAILCGVGSYFLVIAVFNVHSQNFLSAPATAERSGKLASPPENGQATGAADVRTAAGRIAAPDGPRTARYVRTAATRTAGTGRLCGGRERDRLPGSREVRRFRVG